MRNGVIRDLRARQIVEESTLFIEEAHVVYSRMAGATTK